MWPDTSEYSNKYPVAGFTQSNGAPAYLYSANDQQTVDRHFEWMREYGIDGAVVQRFVVDMPPDNAQAWKTNVMVCARAARASHGTGFLPEYDMSGANRHTLFGQLTNDWQLAGERSQNSARPALPASQCRPVLMVFGFYPERFPDTALPKQIIGWFKTNSVCPVTLIGSGWWNWRRGATGEWTNIYRSFDGYCPWNTGNYLFSLSHGWIKKYANTTYWPGDVAEAKKAGMFYMPQLYPGFSWDNLKQLPPGTSKISRLGGDFLWKQFYDAAAAGLDMAYVGMFDEVDEGTAIFKVTNSPPARDTSSPTTGCRRIGICV